LSAASARGRLRLDQARELGLERLPVQPQPVALFAPLRHRLFDQCPEARRMAADAQVAELVYHDVLQCGWRRQREREIERDAVARVEAAPQALERAQLDGRRCATEFGAVARKVAAGVAPDLRFEERAQQRARGRQRGLA